MDTERLIDCVRRHTFLYDVYHKEYKNVNLKATIWELIGKELNQTGEAAKAKWKSIRDGYVKFKKISKTKSGSSKKNVSYLWSSQLGFLDNYRTSTNYALGERPATSAGTYVAPSIEVTTDYLALASNLSPLLSSLEAPAGETSPSTSREITSPRKNKNRVASVDKTFKITNKKKKVDGIDHLFLSYAETFKRFPPKEQALLKLQLAKLFSNTELRLLHQNSDESRASSASPPHSNFSSSDDTKLQDLIEIAQSAELQIDIKKEDE